MATLSAWTDLDKLCGTVVNFGQSLGFFRKHLRSLVQLHDWTEWGERDVFDRRAIVVYRAIFIIIHSEQRLAQLREGGFSLWVYRCSDPRSDCAAKHLALDGLVVAKEHEFWDVWTPPNSYACRCSVAGANSARGAVRLGGNPEKPLPDWWDDPAYAPHQRFIGFARPDLKEIVRAALADEII